MSIFLRWKETAVHSVDRAIAALFANKSISSRWYPVNIIGSTLYDIFYTYADDIASGSAEIASTNDDLSIEGVRTTSLEGRASSKLYENLGVFVDSDKTPHQVFDIYKSSTKWKAYRETVKYYLRAGIVGSSEEAARLCGRGSLGVSPILFQPMLENTSGFRLNFYTGSVVGTFGNYVVVDPPHFEFGSVVPTYDSRVYVTGSVVTISQALESSFFVSSQKDLQTGCDIILIPGNFETFISIDDEDVVPVESP